MTVVSRTVDVGGIPMSGLLAVAPQPRAVIVALHGGATTSRYFDCPGRPELSLLRTGPELGFTVLALDRPGYGSSAAHAERVAPAERRVDLAYAAVDRFLDGLPRGAGLFLLAHSIGSELALRMATDDRAASLLGLELAGTGRHHHDVALEILNGGRTGLQGLIWQPAHLYPAEVVGGASIGSRGPAYELGVVQGWAARDFPRLAARVRIPVHFSLGEHELVWRSGPDGLADVTAMFTAAPRVTASEQAYAGHNVSLGLTARAYHLKVFSFVEECVVGAARRLSEVT